MDADYTQPWSEATPIDDEQKKRRLGLNLPQLLSPLSQTPASPARPNLPPLSSSVPDRSLGIEPPDVGSPLSSAPSNMFTPPTSQPTKPGTDKYRLEQSRPELHGGKLALDILGQVFAPRIEAAIPGSPGYYDRLQARDTGQRKERLGEAATQSEIELREAEAAKARRETPGKEEEWGVIPNVVGPDGQPVQQEKRSGQVRPVTTPGVTVKEPTPKPDTQTQNKERFQGIIAKVDAAKLPTDPKSLPKSLDAARQRGAITPEEHQTASGYLAANPTPSTTVQVQTIGKETSQDIKDANTYYRWTDPATGKVTTGKGGKVPKGADAEPIGSDKDYALHLREASAANIVQQSLNRVAQDIDEYPELFDNASARNIMATSLEQIDRASAGILVAGTGGSIPLPSGMGDMINTALQNNALDAKTASALKQYIADYKAMKDKGIVQQMEMQGGRIGRGSAQVFSAIVDQIPNGKTADSATARRQVANMQATQDRLMRQYADKDKEQPYKMKQSGDAQSGDMEYGTWKGQKVQRPKDGSRPWEIVRPQQ